MLAGLYVVLSMISACGEDMQNNEMATSTEILFFNGSIYTMDPNNPWADALLVKDSVIDYVGLEAEARNRGVSNAVFQYGRPPNPQ